MTGQLFSYSLASGIILICLYTVYRFALRQTTLFGFNRACIIGLYILAFTLPFFSISLTHEPAGTTADTAVIAASDLTPSAAVMTESSNIVTVILWIYLIGICVSAAWFIGNIAYLIVITACSKKVNILGYDVCIHNNRRLAPFS